MTVDDLKLLDDVEVMQTADGFVPSVWRNLVDDFLLGVKGYEILPVKAGAALPAFLRVVLLTTDPKLDRIQLSDAERLFSLSSHRSAFADDDRVQHFKCKWGHDTTMLVDWLAGVVLGKATCSQCGYDLMPMLRVFQGAVAAQREVK